MLVNSGSKFKKDQVITLKNILGEEIIATYVSEDDTTYTIKDPLALGMGQQGLQFMPCVMSGNVDGDLSMQKQHFLWVVPTISEIKSQYTQQITGISVPSKPNIIV